MYLISNILLNSLSVLMLLVILLYSVRFNEKEPLQNKLYIMLVIANIIMLILDALGRMDGHPDTVFPIINHISNFFLFLLSPLIASLWVLFVYHFINRTEHINKKLLAIIISLNSLNTIIVLLSLKFHWLYYIDNENIYHRGPLHIVSIIIPFSLLLVAFIFIFNKRNTIINKHYYTFVSFNIPPLISSLLQVVIYGFSFIYNGIALSIFILFLYVQIQDIFTDYLTGVANRKKLEIYLKKKIQNSGSSTFSAIMIDIDNFKKVNDTYGHKTGDMILQNTASMMRNCISEDGLIARYGGDEFCIVLDISDSDKLQLIVDKLKKCIDKFNQSSIYPFKLGLSMGYAIYKTGMSLDDFQNMIDKLMYEQKRCEL